MSEKKEGVKKTPKTENKTVEPVKANLNDTVEIREVLDKLRKVHVSIVKAKEEYAALEAKAFEIAKRNANWFKDDNGGDVYTKTFGTAKLVWKQAAPKYNFPDAENKDGLKLILSFIKENPAAIKLTAVHSKMSDIELDSYGIAKVTAERKLTVEV
jgi:hypothetical protein